MKVYEVWDDGARDVVKVEALSLDDAVEDHARALICDAGGMSDNFDVVARDDSGEWVRVSVSWEERIDVTLGRVTPCRDPRGEVGE